MAKISFENVNFNENQGGGNYSGVGFFTLKNDGDCAVVRIMHDSTDDFEIHTVHPITVDGKFRTANCIRNPYDPVQMCPLCANNTKINQKIYLHMIQYDRDPNTGNVVASPKVWERSIGYATKLKTLIDEYGPLSDCIFKIKRNGKAGSVDTTYEIMFCNPSVYPPSVYVKDEEAFKNYSSIGKSIMDKNAEELEVFVKTGSFPSSNNKSVSVSAGEFSSDHSNIPMPEFIESAPQQTVNNFSQNNTPPQSMPWDRNNGSAGVQRPTRHY